MESKTHKPYHNGYGYSWFSPLRESPSDLVPSVAEVPQTVFLLLRDWLTNSQGKFLNGNRFRSYASESSAMRALNEALQEASQSKAK